jgi:hypothetical protein
MSLKPHLIQSVPEETARVAQAAFPHGTPIARSGTPSAPLSRMRTLRLSSRRVVSRAFRPGASPW